MVFVFGGSVNWRVRLHRAARYKALYVLLGAWLIMVLVAPTASVQPPGTSAALGAPSAVTAVDAVPPGMGTAEPGAPAGPSLPGAGPGPATGGVASPPRGAGPAARPGAGIGPAGTSRDGGGSTPETARPAGSPERAVGRAPAPTGTAASGPAAGGPVLTRTGADCRPGVRQFASAYAPPCRAAWTGPNGGATYRGVSADTISLVSRRYGDSPDNLLVKQLLAQAGQAPENTTAEVRSVFLDYFNKTYELYGRRVVIADYTTNSSMLDEVNGKGREQACADAAAIADERKAFGALPPPGGFGFATFSECAVAQRLFLPIGAYGYPESWYRQAHPYAWGIQMDCERVVHQLAEYIGKRLAGGRPARWARDPQLASGPRVFGMIAPDFGLYRGCVDLFVRDLTERYGVKIVSRYNYTLDPSTSSQQAAQAVVQFKAAGVTTLLLLADPVTNIQLTSQARSQQWGPEWVISGAGLEDNDDFTRLYDQDRVNGHLFGLSELGSREANQGPRSEPGRLYQQLTGRTLPSGTDGDYFTLVHLFNLLSGAGPGLSPEAVGTGAARLPASGGPGFDFGLWSLRSGTDGSAGLDHNEVDDAREVYWDGNATSFDGKKGAFIAAYGGRRFGNGEWPSEDPAYYQDACAAPCQGARRPSAAARAGVAPGRGAIWFLPGLIPARRRRRAP